jgi:hypothetical protein
MVEGAPKQLALENEYQIAKALKKRSFKRWRLSVLGAHLRTRSMKGKDKWKNLEQNKRNSKTVDGKR